MAAFMKEKVAGISVPEDILQRLEKVADKQKEGLLITREIVAVIKNYNVGGIHVMAVGQENELPNIIKFLLES